jgi:MFS family permease
MVGWQDMIAKVIPLSRRGRFFSLSNFGGTVGGMVASLLVVWLLANYPFPRGYALGFTLGAAAIFISWFFLAQTREPASTSSQPDVSLGQYLKTLPGIVRRDRNFKNLLLTQLVMGLNGLGAGFLIVYVTQRWALPDSQAGVYSFVTLVGQAVAYLVIGSIADRKGHKVVLELFALITAASYLVAWLGTSPGWFYPVFILKGVAFSCNFISGMLIALEFGKPEMRPTYIGLNSTIAGVSNAIAPLIGGWLALVSGFQPLFGIAVVVSLAGYAALHWMVREPREGVS